MKRTQFIVKVAGKEDRKTFYEYIMNTYKLEKWYVHAIYYSKQPILE